MKLDDAKPLAILKADSDQVLREFSATKSRVWNETPKILAEKSGRTLRECRLILYFISTEN